MCTVPMKVQRNSTQLITNTKAECAVCGATEPSQVLETTVRMELRGWWCGTVGCRYSLRNRAHSLPICSPNKYLRFSYSAHRMVECGAVTVHSWATSQW